MSTMPVVGARRESVARESVAHASAPRDVETKSSTDDAPRASDTSKFSILMALLAGTGPRVRSEIVRQMPEHGASLLDTLLANASDDASSESDVAAAMIGTPTSDATLPLTLDPAGNAQAAIDGMRYNGIADGHRTDRRMTEMANLIPVESPSASPDRSAAGVLRRVALDRSATTEQLRARGDEAAADLRATLDALLSRAGTDTGAQLAMLDQAGVSPGTPIAAAIAAAALGVATAKSTADPTVPVRDVDALAPGLRHRLGRVIERMNAEYGHDVTIVETVRSQERQDMLYEQGRSRPGPVVTWTRDSAHARGDAVDVVVDGRWNNPDGFARLQRIAREEGLHTLGARDPGHLELARNATDVAKNVLANTTHVLATSARPTPLDAVALTGASSGRLASEIARSALTSSASPVRTTLPQSPVEANGVAGVASIANVAAVAQVATSGGSGGGSTATFSDSRSSGGRGDANDTAQRDGAASGGSLKERRVGRAPNTSLPDAAAAMQSGATAHDVRATPAAVSAPAVPAGAATAQRALDIQDMRDAAPGSVSRLVLSVDGENGAMDQITVDVRGMSVGTEISTDRANAERLRANAGELQQALGRHGFESEGVRVITPSRVDGTDANRTLLSERVPVATANASSDGNATGSDTRDRSSSAREWEKQDDARRSRGEEREARQDARGREGRRHRQQDAQ